MRRIGAVIAALVLAGTGLATASSTAGAAPAATARATACPTGWGSGAKGGPTAGAVPLDNIRTGRHACFDRMVFDVPGGGRSVGFSVRYVHRLHQTASGRYIPVGGGAILDVHIGAPSYDPETGTPTYPGRVGHTLPGVNVSGYRTFRDTRFAGSFEGETQIGLGVRARLPFRVIQLPDRVVVDVAHNWTGSR
ncbi:AMIN-like domain-containing (lipo)protein [Streptomyces diastatochromogenes]|uniref:AMIN-like domain-containing (lipo)protein n=1 Tax=Streptomyces diastatochromogenes TaxID=42236 RepID=UPI0036C35CC4